MSWPRDLLEQARHLANRERQRPKQVSLRRAVSAAYYALFHLLVDEASSFLIRGQGRTPLRQCLSRAFSHADMRAVSKGFSSGNISNKIRPALDGQAIPSELCNVARMFVALQEIRHKADYDPAQSLTRQEVNNLVDRTEQAFRDWQAVRGTLQADVFLTALLAQKHMQT
ncbi:MAG: hypothetical protein ACFB9N_08775 [Geitlerinemataceae cyanobacterium]